VSIVCTVRIPHPLERVTRYEAENAQLMEPIIAAAQKHMSGHRRIENDREVIDLDEFGAMGDYDAFMADAGDAVRAYNEAMGVTETHYRVVEGG
jgi:hypothetical protein